MVLFLFEGVLYDGMTSPILLDPFLLSLAKSIVSFCPKFNSLKLLNNGKRNVAALIVVLLSGLLVYVNEGSWPIKCSSMKRAATFGLCVSSCDYH